MKIGLLGHGIVGSGVSKIIDAGVSGNLEITRILVKDESEKTDPRCTLDVQDILTDPDIDIVAECMGGLEPAHSFLVSALNSGKHIVTSNKKMLAAFEKELLGIAAEKDLYVGYEASCGGGIPWMANLERIRRIEPIRSFRGIFNGTTNYILSAMTQQNADFDEMLKEAQKLGYAERDPSDDIDGLDVQYKVVLSLMKAFGALVSPSDIPAFGIRNISSQDIAYAKSCGRTVKLIGRGSEKDGHISAWVMPAMVSDSDPFANISLNYNALESNSDTLGTAVFTGQGAGSLPTAHAVVQDLIDISQTDVIVPQLCEKKTDLSDVYGTYYIRSEKLSEFNAFLESDTFGGAAVTKKVSLKQLLEKIKEVQDSSLFIAEVVQYD